MAPPEVMRQRSPRLLDVIIVGGGLSGMMVTNELQKTSLAWRLLEARPVLGGRLANDEKGHSIDLGGAWIWPFQQPNMKRLTQSLSIPTFPQPDDHMSTRIDGGAVLYIHRLNEGIPKDSIQLDSPVTLCTLMSMKDVVADDEDNDDTADGVSCSAKDDAVVRVETASHESYFARRVVLAVPPKLIAKHITFDPPLSDAKQSALNASQTWMAGVTKVGLVYPSHFWDEHSSNMGFPDEPAFQVYDSSTKDAVVSALTFFAVANTDDDKKLADDCAKQIQSVWSYYRRPFADKALDYVDFHVKRWPTEEYLSEDPNPKRINPHPQPVRALSTNEWDGRLLFAGSESDRLSPGVMEGAVGAALRVVKDLQSYLFASSNSSS